MKLMKQAAAKIGAKVVGVAMYGDTDTDVTPEWQKVLADKPDAVWVTTQGQSATVFKARSQSGATSIPTICDTSGTATPLSGLLGFPAMANSWGAALPIQFTPAAKRTANEKQYVAAVKAAGGAPEYAIPALMYDSLMIVAQAARQANSIDTVAVTNALEHLKTKNTAFGGGYPIQFSKSWHFSTQLSAPSPYTLIPLDWPFKGGAYQKP